VLPIDIWPLVKVHPDDPKVCEAFDGIVAGMEIVGGGTDINDPVEQRQRFIGQRERQEKGAEADPHPHDEEFVKALEYGMPPASETTSGREATANRARTSEAARPAVRAA